MAKITSKSKAMKKGSVVKKNVATKAQQPTPKKAHRGGRRRSEVENLKPSANSTSTPYDWKELAIIGEKPENIRMLKAQNHWDFSNLEPTVAKILKENPGYDVFLAGGSPQPNYSASTTIGASTCPDILAIVIRSGFEPPRFVSKQDFQHGTDKILPMRSVRFTWAPMLVQAAEGGGKVPVHMLKNLECRKAAPLKMSAEMAMASEYLTLFTMKPSQDWVRKPDGKLVIKHVMFAYDIGEEGLWEESFDTSVDRLNSFIPDFCERFELDEETHHDEVNFAIREAFEKARQKVETRIKLLENYPEDVLDNIKVVKIFPRNGFVVNKSNYVNKYYDRADLVE
jgi:hypothetical protein